MSFGSNPTLCQGTVGFGLNEHAHSVESSLRGISVVFSYFGRKQTNLLVVIQA